MRLDVSSHMGFDVVDEAMSRLIEGVLWVDDTALEVVALEQPLRWTGHELATVVTKVAYVRVDAPAKRILVNTCVGTTYSVAPLAAAARAEPRACADCCQEAACRRTAYCAAHRTSFGELPP